MNKFGFLKTTSAAETFEVPDAASEIKAGSFWKVGLEGLPSWEHHCISSLFLMPIPLDNFSRASSNDYKKGKIQDRYKGKGKDPLVQPIQNPA